MDVSNKRFKNRLTGEVFTIIDQYQNIAITSDKQKIDVNLLSNDKLFTPVKNSVNESFSLPKTKEDIVDPNKFFDDQSIYNTFADKIKNVDLSKLQDDNRNPDISKSYNNNNLSVSNESAIIMSDPEDEVEELKRKYGVTSVDESVRRQNETFARILDPQPEQPQEPIINTTTNNNIQQPEIKEYVEPDKKYSEPPIQRFEVQDPVITMFKNVKRNTEFKINLKVDGKIPRLDFIEMMEDSYEISIIEYLADEFTDNILRNPSIIRNKIMEEIKSMIDKKNGVTKPEVRKIPEVKKEDREVLNERLPTPVKSRRKPVVKKPTPPPTQIIPEGKDPIQTKNMSV
jgi:hypothetical protein